MHGKTVASKWDLTLSAWVSDRDRDILVSLNSSRVIFVLRGSLRNVCDLSTLAQ